MRLCGDERLRSWHIGCSILDVRKRRPPSSLGAGGIALVTSLSAWPAAAYGALVVCVAGDFRASGTLWIFGWPFLLELLIASALHLLAVGAGARLGLPSPVRGIDAFDRPIDSVELSPAAHHERLSHALRAAERFPIVNGAIGMVISVLVVLATAVVEQVCSRPGAANTWVIVRGGVYAIALYAPANLALGEWLARPICRNLRVAAAATDIERYGSATLSRSGRLALLAVPTLVALGVAVELGAAHRAGTLAYGALIAISAVVAIGLNTLQYANAQSAMREVREACLDLAAGREASLITGSIEPALQDVARDFTAAAERVAARHRAVVEAALDGIITVAHDGAIVEVNPAAGRILGCSQRQLAGRDVAEIIPALTPGSAHAGADLALIGRRSEQRVRRADGSTFAAEISVARMARAGTGMLTVLLRDITDRKRAEDRLARSRTALREHAEITSALLRVGKTLNANPQRPDLPAEVCRLTVEVLGCDAATIFERPRDRDVLVLAANVGSRSEVLGEIGQIEFANDFPLIRALSVGGEVELDDARRAPEVFPSGLAERWRIASLLAVPIVTSGELAGVLVATYRDRVGAFTTKQRELALGIAHASAFALANARLIADLQAASRLKTEFVSTMSHELRTPLNVILGFREMAADPDVTAEERLHLLDRIGVAARTLLDLVEGMLEIGKLESGRDDPTLGPVDLSALWRTLAGEDAARPRGQEVRLVWDPAPLDITVLGDPRRLAMVVRNLVGNALKFTERGTVRATLAVDDDAVTLRVADTGVGIPAADHEKIFGMFRQGDGSDSRRHTGTGLGLYLVRRFVEQCGGTVSLESEIGRGSTFTVRLPRLVPGPPRGLVTMPAA